MARRRIGMMALAAACALAVSACGASSDPRYADNEGPGYVAVGHLYYQVQISRELNPFSDEDSGYLDGLTKAQLQLPPGEEWFGVFLQAYNKTAASQTPANDFFVTDVVGDRYTPIVNPSPNSFTYQPLPIPPGGQLPSLTSLAYFGPTEGEVLLFKFPYTTELNSRPLILHIVDPTDPSRQARIELDV